MSHYTVAVFTSPDGKDVDELLAPYDENISVAPYVSRTKEQIIEDERANLKCLLESAPYLAWKADPAGYEKKNAKKTEHLESLRTLSDHLSWTDEQFYQQGITGYGPDDLDEHGGIISTYNPNSKWDWYQTGGRWSGYLLLKQNIGPDSGKQVNSALASDVDFLGMMPAPDQITPYEQAAQKFCFGPLAFKEKFPTEESYLKDKYSFYTYAVVTPDGFWHAPGTMGWWGISSEDGAEGRKWTAEYDERFIRPAIQNGWTLTIVDCHI